jgi:hypothetical protein
MVDQGRDAQNEEVEHEQAPQDPTGGRRGDEKGVTEMSRPGTRLLLLTPLLVLGCTTSTDPARLLTVTGTVTQSGEPATATISLTAGNFSASRAFDQGTFSLTLGGGGVPESACPTARVQATILEADGQTVLDEETRHLGECGEHTVHFEFP